MRPSPLPKWMLRRISTRPQTTGKCSGTAVSPHSFGGKGRPGISPRRVGREPEPATRLRGRLSRLSRPFP